MVTKLMITNILQILSELFFRQLKNAHPNGQTRLKCLFIKKQAYFREHNGPKFRSSLVACTLFVDKIKGLRYPDATGL